MSTSRIAESFPKLEEWISTTASTGTLPMATSGEKASSLLLQKPFRCQKANCNKSFMTQNGLKYHTVYGICNFVPGRDLEDHKDSAERRSEKTASVSVGTSNESEGGPHQGALNRQQKGTGLVPTPPSNLDTPSQQHIPTQSSTTSETALSNDSTLSKISPQDLESSIEAERRLRPFACGVDDCQKRYKNIYGLKYHYQHTGEHGVVGLERLENGQHECLAIDKRRHDAISTSEEDQRGTRIGHADSTNAQHASEWIGARPIKGDVSVNHAHSASVATVRNDPSYRSEQLSVPLWMHTHDTVAYLDGVMLDLAKDEVTLKSFRSEFEKWSEARMPAFSGSWKNRDKSNRSIFRMAEILRFKPKLVQGLKNLLFPGQKLECFFNDKEVEYFIFVNTPSDIQIRCTLPDMALFPSSDCDIRFMANPSHTWKSTVLTNRGKDWVACVSRAIELMLENPSPDFPLQERHRVRELRDILITYLRYGELSINIGTSTKCTSIGLDAATAIIPATQPEQKAVEWKGSNSATPHNFPQDSYQLKMLGYDAQVNSYCSSIMHHYLEFLIHRPF
ncbi:hypothetical protein BDZ97DRAFT_848081 [Flammula alnicola]|nr:hypothetical protein BDZ97DRAFT_848081 [Flammula alnicola]